MVETASQWLHCSHLGVWENVFFLEKPFFRFWVVLVSHYLGLHLTSMREICVPHGINARKKQAQFNLSKSAEVSLSVQ